MLHVHDMIDICRRDQHIYMYMYMYMYICWSLLQMSIQLEKSQQSLEKQLQEMEQVTPHHDLIG